MNLTKYFRSKTKQLKRLAAELNMAETSMSEQESEIGRLNTELKECKQKYLELKKHELAQRKRQPSESIRNGCDFYIQIQHMADFLPVFLREKFHLIGE